MSTKSPLKRRIRVMVLETPLKDPMDGISPQCLHPERVLYYRPIFIHYEITNT